MPVLTWWVVLVCVYIPSGEFGFKLFKLCHKVVYVFVWLGLPLRVAGD